MKPLDLLAEQLWGPGRDDPADNPRIVVDAPATPGWRDVERYFVLPDPTRARLLVPHAPPAVVRGAVTHYRGLRRLPANTARGLLGAAATAKVPLSRHRLMVRVPAGSRGETAAAALPLATIARELGHPRLYATFGVRTGANRKATLQLLAEDGTTVGYAKLGWNSTADEYVRTEADALSVVGARPGQLRAPGVLASFDQGGRPVVVVAPLPADVRRLRGPRQDPTSAELFALAPVVRTDRAGSTRHLVALTERAVTLFNHIFDDIIKGSRLFKLFNHAI